MHSALGGLLLAGLAAAMVLRVLVPGVAAAFSRPWVNLFVAALPLLLLVLIGLRSLLEGEFRLPRWEAGIPAALFLGWAAISAAAAGHRAPAVETWTDWAGAILLAYVLHLHVQDPRARSALIACFVVMGGVVAALGAQEAFVGKAIAREVIEAHPDLVHVPRELEEEFRGRLESSEVSGPFLLSNLLAGYLVVLIPITLGLLFDQRSGAMNRAQRVRIGTLLSIIGIEGWCLATTGSKGGWVALAGGAIAFWMALRPPRPGRLRTGLIAGAVLVGVLLATGWSARVGVARRLGGESIEIRDEYFQAARGIIADHPFAGVGLGGFRDFYPSYRPETAEETKFAHNNYLQVAAEMGVPGVLLLLYFFVPLLAGLASDRMGEIRPSRPQTLLVFFGGVGGVVTLSAFPGSVVRHGDWISVAFILAVWGLFLLLYSAPSRPGTPASRSGRGLRAGGIAAAVGAGLHWSVDFDLYSAGVLFSVLAALVLAGPPARRSLRISYGVRLGTTLLLLLITMLIFTLYFPPMMARDSYFAKAEDFYWEAFEEEGWKKERGLNLARHLYEQAEMVKSWDAIVPLQKGRVLFELYRVRSGADSAGSDLKEAIRSFERARDLAPQAAEIRFELARAYVALSVSDAAAIEAAEQAFSDAVERYPSKPAYRYRFARFLYEVKYKAEGKPSALGRAREEAREALRLEGLTRHARLRLPAYARRTCQEILAP